VEISSSNPVILTFLKSNMAASTMLDFHDMWIWHVQHWWLSVSRAVYHICFRRSTDDVMSIHFRFRFLATWTSWSSLRGRVHRCGLLFQNYQHRRNGTVWMRQLSLRLMLIGRIQDAVKSLRYTGCSLCTSFSLQFIWVRINCIL